MILQDSRLLILRKTWDAYLKILLVITDTVLKSESKKVVSHLATFALRVRANAVHSNPQVLFEVWFLAKTQDEELWGALRKLAVEHEWRDRTICMRILFRLLMISRRASTQ